jgi:altronate dehydratase large subunit
MSFSGYLRPDGAVGVRNHIMVMAVSQCIEPVAGLIAKGIPGAVAVTQHGMCLKEGNESVLNTLIGCGQNGNVAAVLVIGMGCESMNARLVGEAIALSGKPVRWLVCQDEGGTRKTVAKGRKIIRQMRQDADRLQRQTFPDSKLIIGMKCGGSDTTMGLAANPAIGAAADRVVDAGGAAFIIEPIEAIGAEAVLTRRAANEEVKRKIVRMVANEEKRFTVPGCAMEFMCQGNIDGGLTTIEEKSLGAIHKTGDRPISGVLEFGRRCVEKITAPGLYLQDGTHYDTMSFSIMAAAGAQIIVFSTGRGATLGHAIVPMIHVCSHPDTYRKMKADMDINAGTIVQGKETVGEVGGRIYDEIREVASGKLTRAEKLGYNSFSCFYRDPRLDALLGIKEGL